LPLFVFLRLGLRLRRGIHCELVRRALCIIAPCSTPNDRLLTTFKLSSQECDAAWSLIQAAGERQHAIHHYLGSGVAF
jgi:hypothetical protein